MKNKNIIILIAIAIVILLIALFVIFGGNNITNNSSRVSDIKNDSYLDIIVNLGNFSYDEYDEAKLLDVSMQVAEKLGLQNESDKDGMYIQYVTKNDLHKIIYELTGMGLEAPIIIEDFYYLYDGENNYYYFVPASPEYYKVKEINKIQEKNNTYTVNCSLTKTIDLEETTKDNVSVELTYCPNNSLIKYQVNKVKY